MLQLYGNARSRAMRCLWMLEEVGQPYQLVDKSLRADDLHSADYLKLNPNARIPTLVDGELVLWESMAINLYLAQKYPGPMHCADAAVHMARGPLERGAQDELGPHRSVAFVMDHQRRRRRIALSDDDGKTFYPDSVFNFPPYDHNGKPANRAFVYQCDRGKFVGFAFAFMGFVQVNVSVEVVQK